MYTRNRNGVWTRKAPRRIKVTDKIIQKDVKHLGGLKGIVILGKGRHEEEYIDPYGRKATRSVFEEITSVEPNIVPIGGYQFVFDKLFNIGLDQETTLRVGDLNDESPQMKIGIPRDAYKSIYYNAEISTMNPMDTPNIVTNPGINISAMNYVFGFMMGDGGAKEDNITAIAPNYKDRGLYHAVPFRMSNDGYSIPNGMYYGKYQSYQSDIGMDPITSSFVKKFDDPQPRIIHAYASDNPDEIRIVDDAVFSSTSSDPIESYTEVNFSINKYDGRGFSASTGATPRFNELALVSGWYNSELDDYESLRIITHFCRPTIILSEGDSIEGIYRLYGR